MATDADKALITLAEVKSFLKCADDNDDSILETLINVASIAVANYLGRDLVQKKVTEYYNGDGGVVLILRNWPIVSVESVHIDSNRQFTSLYLVDPSRYIVKKDVGVLQAFDLLGEWSHGKANIKVVYTAGYVADASKEGVVNPTPHDIRYAIMRVVQHHYLNAYTHRRMEVSSETIGDRTTNFKDGDLQADVKRLLDPYRKCLSASQFSHAD